MKKLHLTSYKLYIYKNNYKNKYIFIIILNKVCINSGNKIVQYNII